MIAAAITAFVCVAAIIAWHAIGAGLARARRGSFPKGFVDETRLEATPAGHVAMHVKGIDGQSATHVLDARQAHVLSSQLLGAVARATSEKGS